MLRPHGYSDDYKSGDYVKVRVRKKVDFYFINLDLELKSTESVAPLLKELDEKILTTHPGGIEEFGILNLRTYKKSGRKNTNLYNTFDDAEDEAGGANVFINEFCEAIENLSAASKEIWDKCYLKEFDLGFQTGNTQKTFRTTILSNTVKRCAELGASIKFTVYPHLNFDFIRKEDFEKKVKK